MKIAVIGAGFTGMALAVRLSRLGHQVTVLERERQTGGLATWHDFGPFVWDRFYHAILPSDTALIGFLRDIGLAESLGWTRTLTGFYANGQFHSLSSGLEFARFPLLGPVGKLRLAWTMLYGSRVEDWRQLERVTVEEWLVRVGGRQAFERIWRPLLLAKLGEHYHRVSAVFIWSYIRRLFSARDPSTQKEHLGYVAGGYHAVFKRMEELLLASGGELQTGVQVQRIGGCPDGGLWVDTDGTRRRYAKVVFTGPEDVLRRVTDGELYQARVPGGVEYLGVVCGALVTRRPLVPYYIVNIADARVPFTGLIGMSGLVPTTQTAGLYLTYLPKYVHSRDPLLDAPDDTLRKRYTDGLRRMFPRLDDCEPVALHFNRARRVQPLQVLDYSRHVPRIETTHKDFFVLNTAQLVAATLNNNEVVRAVDAFVATHGRALRVPDAQPRREPIV